MTKASVFSPQDPNSHVVSDDDYDERSERHAFNPSDPVALTNERHNQHGDWLDQSDLSSELKTAVRRRIESHGGNHSKLKPHQQEAVEAILVKIARICCGDPNLEDHWNDIAGYAHLGKGGHTG